MDDESHFQHDEGRNRSPNKKPLKDQLRMEATVLRGGDGGPAKHKFSKRSKSHKKPE